MAVDPNIPLQAQVPQLPNITQALAQGQNLALQRQQAMSLMAERNAQTADIQAKADAAQRLAQQNAAVDSLMKTAFTPDPDTGAMLFKPEVLQQGLIQANMGHLWPQMSESVDRMNESAMKTNAQRRQQLAENLFALQNAPDAVKYPSALTVIAGLKHNELMSPDHEQAAMQALAASPTADTVNQIVQQYGAALPEFQTLQTTRAKSQAELAETQAKTAQAQAAAGKDIAGTVQTNRQQDAAMLATARSSADYASRLAQLPSERQAVFPPAQAWTSQTPQTLLRMGMTPEQQVAAANAAANTAIAAAKQREEARHDVVTESFQDPTSAKNQNMLEQQYRGVLVREISSRAGGLGVEDQKVNQAIHLLSLFDQSQDAKGNYNIPKAQYAELASGLASLISPKGVPTDAARTEIETRTAKGDLNGALTYITGTPFNGSTQDIYKMLRDSIQRQGTVAESNRSSYLKDIQAMAPTMLDPQRKQQLEKGLLNTSVNAYRVGQVVNVGGKQIRISALHSDGTFDGTDVK